MTAEEFLNQLEACLQSLTSEERNEAMAYYREYFAEAGEDADKAAEKLGSPQSVAARILSELDESRTDAFTKPEQKQTSAGSIIFGVIILIFTSPFWFTVLMLWLALVFSLGVTLLSFAFSAIAAPIQGISYFMHGFPGNGLYDIGAGLLYAGLVMLLWKPFLMLAEKSTKWLWNKLKQILSALFGKEMAA